MSKEDYERRVAEYDAKCAEFEAKADKLEQAKRALVLESRADNAHSRELVANMILPCKLTTRRELQTT